MKDNVVSSKLYLFALAIVKLCQHLAVEKREFILSKQLLRSETAVGALIREAEHAESPRDFLHKMSISLKEANETLYWLQLLKDSSIIDTSFFNSIYPLAEELVKILVSIVKTTKRKLI